MDQVFATEFLLFLAEKWLISQLRIFEKQFAKGHHRRILLMYYPKDYKNPVVIYVDFASFEFQRHEVV